MSGTATGLSHLWATFQATAGRVGRRQFLGALGVGGAAALLPRADAAGAAPVRFPGPLIERATKPTNGQYTLPPLPYPTNALEPTIDAETMQIHHQRHHQTYVDNLNAALAPYPELRTLDATAIIANLAIVPEAVRTRVRNNGGGHVNHSIFWAIMGPTGGGAPVGALAGAIGAAFGSFDTFKAQFEAAGRDRFGSGWVWLAIDGAGTLRLTTTPNQDSPYMEGLTPLVGNDVWEHAYYLKHRDRRAAYLAGWWATVNWEAVALRYAAARG